MHKAAKALDMPKLRPPNTTANILIEGDFIDSFVYHFDWSAPAHGTARNR
jgi:hypothetical protein